MAKKNCLSEEALIKIKHAFKDDPEIMEELKRVSGCKKRQPSAYQAFVGDCMRQGGSIKNCAVEWQKKKGQ